MASHVNVTVDTTAPADVAVVLDGGASVSSDTTVSAAITTSDGVTTGYQVKIWGSVQGAATEGAASWVALASPHNVVLTSGDGVKTVNVRMRDDVGNESSIATDTIDLNTTIPVVTVNSGPTASRISEVAGFDRSSFAWSVDVPFDEYKVKVVSSISDPHTAGTLVPSAAGSTNVAGAAGSYPASTNITTEVDGTDVKAASAGDGAKILKAFVRQGPNWSA